MLSGTYFCLNSIKIENQTESTKKVTKKEEKEEPLTPVNLC